MTFLFLKRFSFNMTKVEFRTDNNNDKTILNTDEPPFDHQAKEQRTTLRGGEKKSMKALQRYQPHYPTALRTTLVHSHALGPVVMATQ